MNSQLSERIWTVARQSRRLRPVWQLYCELEETIQRHGLACRLCGHCCRFEQFGHRLYVTSLELAVLCSGLACRQPTGCRIAGSSWWDGTGCPFQDGGTCKVHQLRPLGCRIFFCHEQSTAWQHETYERLHAVLRRLHDTIPLPYRYVEWRQGLQMVLPLQAGSPQDSVKAEVFTSGLLTGPAS